MAWSKAPSRRAYEFAGETIRSKVVPSGREFRRSCIGVIFSFAGSWSGQVFSRASLKAVRKILSIQSRTISGMLVVIFRLVGLLMKGGLLCI